MKNQIDFTIFLSHLDLSVYNFYLNGYGAPNLAGPQAIDANLNEFPYKDLRLPLKINPFYPHSNLLLTIAP